MVSGESQRTSKRGPTNGFQAGPAKPTSWDYSFTFGIRCHVVSLVNNVSIYNFRMVTDEFTKKKYKSGGKKNRGKDKTYMDTQRLPKKEEEEDHRPSSTFESINAPTDDFDRIFDITIGNLSCSHEFTWDFWEEEEEDEDEDVGEEEKPLSTDKQGASFRVWDKTSMDNEDKELGLKLNLNHQEVIDAWSDRQQPLWTDTLTPANVLYRGEVPVIEEERNMRREASVLRYKEKRQSRLFSKKIRYQVRKLNADKRPRFKGRFVKRET